MNQISIFGELFSKSTQLRAWEVELMLATLHNGPAQPWLQQALAQAERTGIIRLITLIPGISYDLK